jgi:hypothetical protein
MTKEISTEMQSANDKRAAWGNALIRFCGFGLMFSSAVKFLHPAKAVAYMASMGYEGGAFYFIAAIEMLIALLFLLPRTRPLGLLLVSGYLGGAMSAHLAIHRFSTGGPFLAYMADHRYVGMLVPGVFLALSWIAIWLRHPSSLRSLAEGAYESVLSRREHPETAVVSRP